MQDLSLLDVIHSMGLETAGGVTTQFIDRSTVANVDGVDSAESGKLLNLSEQQLMDCDAADDSCNGDLPSNTFQSIVDHGMGLESESAYPNKAKDATCSQITSQEKRRRSLLLGIKPTLMRLKLLRPCSTMTTLHWHQCQNFSMHLNASLLDCYMVCGISVRPSGQDLWLVKKSWGT